MLARRPSRSWWRASMPPDDPALPQLLDLLAEVRADERREAAARVRGWAESVAAHRLKRIDRRFVEAWFLQAAAEIEKDE